jgi:hypothetical protein
MGILKPSLLVGIAGSIIGQKDMALSMGRWKPGAKEFTVKVSINRRQGNQVNLPKPIAAYLGNPREITFKIGKSAVTVEGS